LIFGEDRNELRRMYATAWSRHSDGLPLSPLEAQIARVVDEHPEYREAVLGDPDHEYAVEAGKTNPFLHMGLHLAIRDQVATDRPPGIASIFKSLRRSIGDAHVAEHRMIDCLAETLWEAQGRNAAPDEAAYLERLRLL